MFAEPFGRLIGIPDEAPIPAPGSRAFDSRESRAIFESQTALF